MRPYVLYVPAYTHRSAGIRALHRLCDELNARGYHAVTTWPSEAGPCGCCTVEHPPLETLTVAERKQAITLLPDIIQGNPSPSRHVVRWWGNRPGYLPADVHPEGPKGNRPELTFVYSAQIDPNLPRLHLPTVDTDTFRPKTQRGRGTAVYVGKNPARPDVEAELGRVAHITRSWPTTPAMLADLLRRVDTLVSFDPLSSTNFEATLCGTPVVVFPDGQWSRAELERNEAGTLGYCFPGDDLDRTRIEAARAHADYLAKLPGFEADIDRFIETTQAHYK